jgi:hypothetical protein
LSIFLYGKFEERKGMGWMGGKKKRAINVNLGTLLIKYTNPNLNGY